MTLKSKKINLLIFYFLGSALFDDFAAFASTINIPYWEDEKDELLSRGFFGEVYKSKWKDQTVIKIKLHYKKNQFRTFCKEALTLSYVFKKKTK